MTTKPKYSLLGSLKRPGDRVDQLYTISFFPGSKTPVFCAAGGRKVTVFDPSKGLSVLRGFFDEDEKEDFYSAEWTLDSNHKPVLCVAGEAGIVKILDMETCSLSSYLIGHGGPVYELVLHPKDPNLLFSCSKDESCRLWSISAGRCLVVFAGDQGHRDAVLSIDVHASGTFLASSGMDNTIKIWELDSSVIQTTLEHHSKILQESPRPVPDEQWQTFRAPYVQFPAFTTRRVHTDYVDSVKWVGDLIMSKSIECKCILWKPDTRRRSNSVALLRTYPYSEGKLWYVRMGFNADYSVMGVGSDEGSIFLFDVDAGGDSYQELTNDLMRSVVRTVQFSQCGEYLACCCDDGSLWCFRRDGSA